MSGAMFRINGQQMMAVFSEFCALEDLSCAFGMVISFFSGYDGSGCVCCMKRDAPFDFLRIKLREPIADRCQHLYQLAMPDAKMYFVTTLAPPGIKSHSINPKWPTRTTTMHQFRAAEMGRSVCVQAAARRRQLRPKRRSFQATRRRMPLPRRALPKITNLEQSS